MVRRAGWWGALGWGLLVGGRAAAADCAEVDTGQDTLSEGEQRAALILLNNLLREEGAAPEDGACLHRWQVHHVRLGESMTVFLDTPAGVKRLGASSLDELPAVYERLIRAGLEGTDPERTLDRTNVTDAESRPNRVEADPMVTVSVGPGLLLDPEVRPGLAIGMGSRYELDAVALDVLARLQVPTAGAKGVAFHARLGALGFFAPTADQSGYAGGGLGLVALGTPVTALFAPSAEAVVGYTVLRASNVRVFGELTFAAPLVVENGVFVPQLAAAVGFGFPPLRW